MIGTDCANLVSGWASLLQYAAAEYKMNELHLHYVVVPFWSRNELRRAFDSLSKLRHPNAIDVLRWCRVGGNCNATTHRMDLTATSKRLVCLGFVHS
jgi:hypothetical protein